MGPEPSPPVQQPPDHGGGIARQAGIVVVAFVATLILLLGASSLLTTAPQPSGSASASRSAAASTTAPSASSAASGSASAGAKGSAGASGTAGPSGSAAATASSAPASPTPAPSGNQVLIGAGDIADCATGDDAATARLLDQLPGTVFTAGDNALPEGSASQFADCYAPTWGRHLARTRPAPGERDWATRDLAGYLGYFGTAAAPDGVTWYAYDLGWWHIVVLDSACAKVGGCTADSDQGRWLAKDLAASKATCTLAIWHRPLASSGDQGGDPAVTPFWQALYAARAEVVVNAHDRDYERFAPQDPGGREDRANGIREFVVGTGGAPLGGFGPSAANSEFRLAGAHGVLRLVLREKDYAWTFVPSDGTATDSGQTPCH